MTATTPPQAPKPLRLYSHSPLLYWWPVWVAGYVMALLTYWYGKPHQLEAVGHPREWIHPSSNLGVAYFAVLLLVILITNLSLRGLASALVLVTGGLLTLVLAYLGWWDEIFTWFGDLSIHLTMGAYFWFSSVLFLAWVVIVLGLERSSHWEVTSGQLTHVSQFGAGSQSYKTLGLSVEKRPDNLFRHWLLGFGSGDLRIRTAGPTREQFELPNVPFLRSKLATMQRLIATVPASGPDG